MASVPKSDVSNEQTKTKTLLTNKRRRKSPSAQVRVGLNFVLSLWKQQKETNNKGGGRGEGGSVYSSSPMSLHNDLHMPSRKLLQTNVAVRHFSRTHVELHPDGLVLNPGHEADEGRDAEKARATDLRYELFPRNHRQRESHR